MYHGNGFPAAPLSLADEYYSHVLYGYMCQLGFRLGFLWTVGQYVPKRSETTGCLSDRNKRGETGRLLEYSGKTP